MRKVLTVLGVIGITLLLLEAMSWIVLHFGSAQPDPVKSETHLFDAHINHRLNPAFEFSDDPRSRVHSPDGFRQDRAVSIVKPDKTIRIIVLGTSALYGMGSASPYPVHRKLFNDETITHFLQRMLEERLRKDGRPYGVEVINAGVSATKTFHHLMRLNESLVDLDPDIVLNLDGHNDFYSSKLGDRWNGYPYSSNVLVDEFNGRTFFLATFTAIRALAPHSSFFNLLEKGVKRLWYSWKVRGAELPNTYKFDLGLINDHADDIVEAARRGYLRDLWQINRLGEYAGYDHHVFLQPEVLFEERQILSKPDREIQDLTESLQGAGSVELMTKVRRALPRFFGEAGIPYTDLGEIASPATSDKELYIDYCHLSPLGAEVLAGRMMDVVYRMVDRRIRDRFEQPPAETR